MASWPPSLEVYGRHRGWGKPPPEWQADWEKQQAAEIAPTVPVAEIDAQLSRPEQHFVVIPGTWEKALGSKFRWKSERAITSAAVFSKDGELSFGERPVPGWCGDELLQGWRANTALPVNMFEGLEGDTDEEKLGHLFRLEAGYSFPHVDPLTAAKRLRGSTHGIGRFINISLVYK